MAADSNATPARAGGEDNADRQRLQLQRLERSLVRARLEAPDVLPDPDYDTLRYALGLARLHRFAAGGEDVSVDPGTVAPFRRYLLDTLYNDVRGDGEARERLGACVRAMAEIRRRASGLRDDLLRRHTNDFDADTLDREAGQRALVNVAGGGGGAGYVYMGAYACLQEAGVIPDYIVGNSIGAVIGLFRAHQRRFNVSEYMQYAKELSMSDVLTPARRRAETCLPGLLQLHLKALHRRFVTGDHRRPMRLDEMEIPLDIVVAGMRRGSYEHLPADMREVEGRATRWLPLPLRVAARMWRLVNFFNPDVTQPFVFGRDADTRSLHAVDAVGFSAAVPTVLQYELRGRAGRTREMFAEFMKRHDLAALVDGGVADNVPARAAWQGVAGGRIGTRNAYYLAFDCFQPRWDPKNLWLWPIAQAVQQQMRTNRVYADSMIRFSPTLSPVNLVPATDSIERAYEWGYRQMQEQLPLVREMLRPVRLDGAGSNAATAAVRNAS